MFIYVDAPQTFANHIILYYIISYCVIYKHGCRGMLDNMLRQATFRENEFLYIKHKIPVDVLHNHIKWTKKLKHECLQLNCMFV